MADWIFMEGWKLFAIALSASLGVASLIGLNRFFGLRSFSKLSGFDFAITVAFGSILASIVMAEDPPILQGAAAFAFLFIVQAGIAIFRRKSKAFSRLIDNEPRLIWCKGEFLRENMQEARVTESDVYAKMREANALRLEDVLAVVMETTGDVSVLHKTGDNRAIDDRVMDDVIGWPHSTNSQVRG